MNDTTRSWPAHRNGDNIFILKPDSNDHRTPATGQKLFVDETNNDRTNYLISNMDSEEGTLEIIKVGDNDNKIIRYKLGEYIPGEGWPCKKVSDN